MQGPCSNASDKHESSLLIFFPFATLTLQQLFLDGATSKVRGKIATFTAFMFHAICLAAKQVHIFQFRSDYTFHTILDQHILKANS